MVYLKNMETVQLFTLIVMVRILREVYFIYVDKCYIMLYNSCWSMVVHE